MQGSFGTSDNDNGVTASATKPDTVGVFGNFTTAVRPASGAGGSGVFGLTASPGGAGVFGANNGTEGVGVQGNGPPGEGDNPSIGVSGFSNSVLGLGVRGVGTWGVAGFPFREAGAGVVGGNDDAFGFLGGYLGTEDKPPVGVFGECPTDKGYAGFFKGNVGLTGTLNFKIDHPLDPANKWLRHSVVESTEMKNIYDGTVVLDGDGQAAVEVEAWFEALNSDFRYQLTAIGVAAPGLHVAEEISNNRFRIAGGVPGSKVCWQVTGVRRDLYARAHPIQVEQEKAPTERGRYLHPEEHGIPAERGLYHGMKRNFDRHRVDTRRPGHGA